MKKCFRLVRCRSGVVAGPRFALVFAVLGVAQRLKGHLSCFIDNSSAEHAL